MRGAPKRASHALLPPFFSLIPTKRRYRAGREQRNSHTGRTAELPCEARPSAPATHFSLLSSPSSLLNAGTAQVENREIHIRDARRNCRARRAQARQPRTFPSFLLPTLYLALLPHPSSLPSAATSSRRAFFMLSLDIPMFFVYNLDQRVIFQSYPQKTKQYSYNHSKK